jgi:hypothetical protein
MRCLMRCAAARRVQPRRWSIVHRRFVSDPLAAVRAGSDFYFDLATMLPKVPVDIFDLESRAWSHCVPAFGICVRGSCLVLRPTFAACLHSLPASARCSRTWREARCTWRSDIVRLRSEPEPVDTLTN